MNKIMKLVEAALCILSLVGTGLLATGSNTGWMCYLVANILGIWFFAAKKLWWVLAMQVGYLGFTCVALIRVYLLA